MSRETVGKISRELLLSPAPTRDPIELEREMHKDYEKNIWESIQRAQSQIGKSRDFYVVVVTKKERLMQNVIRNYFFWRQSCPTPEWDQTVYSFKAADESIEFLWTVPSKDTCELLRDNALSVAPEERDLLLFVLAFYDGSLLEESKKRNKESLKSNIITQ